MTHYRKWALFNLPTFFTWKVGPANLDRTAGKGNKGVWVFNLSFQPYFPDQKLTLYIVQKGKQTVQEQTIFKNPFICAALLLHFSKKQTKTKTKKCREINYILQA